MMLLVGCLQVIKKVCTVQSPIIDVELSTEAELNVKLMSCVKTLLDKTVFSYWRCGKKI